MITHRNRAFESLSDEIITLARDNFEKRNGEGRRGRRSWLDPWGVEFNRALVKKKKERE